MRVQSLYMICATVALLDTGDGIIATVFPPFLDMRGYPVGDIGFVVSIFAMFSLASRMPAGLAYKPQRARQMMYVSAGVFAATLPLYSLANHVIAIVAIRAISGLSFGAASTLGMALLMDILPQHPNRARAMAFYAASMTGGYALGNSLGGWLVDTFGYDWTFYVAAISPLLAALFTPRLIEAARSAKEEPAKARGKTDLKAQLRQVGNGQILAIAQLAFTLNALLYVLNTFFPLYALGIGLNLTSIGFLRGIHSIFGAVTRPFSGEATRIASSDRLANGGIVLVALLIALIPSFNTMTVFVPIFLLLGVIRGVVMVSNTVSLVEQVGGNAERRGVASGVFNTAKDLGNVCGPILGGLIAAHAGIENMLRIGPAVLLALYFGVLVVATRARRRAIPAADGERQEERPVV